jgi:hypothetical protein
MNKGKPSGNDAESKKDVGRKGNYKRFGWPEDAPTQRIDEEGNPSGRDQRTNGRR